MEIGEKITLRRVEIFNFWNLVNDSYRIEVMYEETQNVLVKLSDSFGSCEFIVCKSSRNAGRKIRILDQEGKYAASLSEKKGWAEGYAYNERGVRRFRQVLRMLDKAISSGDVEMTVEASPFPPSLFIPLSEREKKIVELFENGYTPHEIMENVSISYDRFKKIKKSLKRKGIELNSESFSAAN